ncbi:hypothetical protein U1763_10710 [Sphingomonas sp. LB2R24]|uniref:hypothetical protein n=1 Tax=Sphingomonas sorbitolis TaxID=3096165 RepID=UPI002FCA710C
MIAAFLLLLQAVAPSGVATQVAPAAPSAATPTASVPLPPQDWSGLPILPIRRSATIQANTSMYVHGEVMAGRCAKAVRTAQGWTLTLDLAVLATPQGRFRRVTPRAIDCPTVEQYAAGVLVGTPRDAIDLDDTQTDTWYRTSMTFTWAGS